MNEANTFQITTKRKFVICIIFGCLYAITDEFHQSFVGGRSQELRDILIDTGGVFFGAVVVSIVCLIISKIRLQKISNRNWQTSSIMIKYTNVSRLSRVHKC